MEQILSTQQIEIKPSIHAGIWLRCGAYIIDKIILSIPQLVIIFILMGNSFFHPEEQPENPISYKFLLTLGIMSILNWLYFAIMESSSKQATFGKMILDAKVTDLDGNRISFGKATGRYFSKILSSMIFGIGFLMIGFTDKSQGLHDKIAETLVVKK